MDKEVAEFQLKGIREKKARIQDQIDISQKKVELLDVKIQQLERILKDGK